MQGPKNDGMDYTLQPQESRSQEIECTASKPSMSQRSQAKQAGINGFSKTQQLSQSSAQGEKSSMSASNRNLTSVGIPAFTPNDVPDYGKSYDALPPPAEKIWLDAAGNPTWAHRDPSTRPANGVVQREVKFDEYRSPVWKPLVDPGTGAAYQGVYQGIFQRIRHHDTADETGLFAAHQEAMEEDKRKTAAEEMEWKRDEMQLKKAKQLTWEEYKKLSEPFEETVKRNLATMFK